MQHIGLNYSRFVAYIQRAHDESKYIHQDLASREYKICKVKETFSELGKTFERLSFGTIVKLVYGYVKNNRFDSEKARIVLIALKKMHANKINNQRKQFLLLQGINYYWECTQNKWEGFGFNSVNRLYFTLINELTLITEAPVMKDQTNVVQAVISQIPIEPECPKAQTETQSIQDVNLIKSDQVSSVIIGPDPLKGKDEDQKTVFAKNALKSKVLVPKTTLTRAGSEKFNSLGRQYLKTASQTGTDFNTKKIDLVRVKIDPLEVYFKNCETCDAFTKNCIFSNITVKSSEFHTPNPKTKKPTYLIDLLAVLCESEKIDFSNPKCKQAILDIFWYKKESEQEELVAWFKNNSEFSIDYYVSIFKILLKKHGENLHLSFTVVSKLFSCYCSKIQNEETSEQINEGLLNGFTLLLILQPSDSYTIDRAEWLCSTKYFSMENFKTWMNVFVQKDYPASLLYPARDHLIERFFQESGGWQNLIDEKNCEKLLSYMEDSFIDIFWSKNEKCQAELFEWIRYSQSFSPLFFEKCIFTLFDRIIKKNGVELDFFIKVINFLLFEYISESENLEKSLSTIFCRLDQNKQVALFNWMQKSARMTLAFWKTTLYELMKPNSIDDTINSFLIEEILKFCKNNFYNKEMILDVEDIQLILDIDVLLKK